MSARDELLREMTHNHLYMTDDQANELIDAFAHELAERQHATADGNCNCGGCTTVRGIADLVDPQARTEEPR